MKAGDFANAVEMKDSRGTKLRVGQTVVFNQSGVLRVGEIEKFKKRKRGNFNYAVGINIHINYGGKKNTVCRWPTSVLVINKQGDECSPISLDSPPYFEDYEECGYCHRKPFTRHKGSCRQ
jgi:hypothetical protein